jgi:DNA-binding NarL/FixJ family response regulator
MAYRAMKVLIIDDHLVARRGLRTILREAFGLDDCDEAADAESALRLARVLRPDLILLDMHLADAVPAPELCRRLRTTVPDARIVIVTAFDRTIEIRDCLSAGADGCLLKDTSEVDLTAALRTVLAGGSVIDPGIAYRLAGDLATNPDRPPAPQLTRREREVLELLADGCSNRAIAQRLHLSEATVKGYVGRILDKLHASSRLEALVRATDVGLI